jgi:hypothetical protein
MNDTALRVCSIDGCEKPARERRTKCHMHLKRLQRHGDPHNVVSRTRRAKREAESAVTGLCSVDGCSFPNFGSGYCWSHYRRWPS